MSDTAWAENMAEDDAEPLEMDALDSHLPAPQVMEVLEDPGIGLLANGVGGRWRDIKASDKPGVWVDLRRWVDWLMIEYKLSKQTIPPCWYRHTDIVAELYAMRCAEEKTWEGTEPHNTAAFQFHPHLFAMFHRLSNKAGKCLNAGKHVEAASFTEFPADALPYDENDWAEFLVQETDTQTLERGTEDLWWRRRVELVDSSGELKPECSEPVLVPQRMPVPEVRLLATQKLIQMSNHVQVASTSFGKVHSSVWEFTNDPSQDVWQELEVSKEDRSDAGTAFDEGPEDE